MTTQQINFKYTTKYTRNVIDEILEVKSTVGLTARNLLERAKDRTSPLHKLFEWDDKKCGVMHREHQARMIISDIKLIVEDKEIYAFENMSIDVGDTSVREYYDAQEIFEDGNKRETIVRKAIGQLLYWRDKYKTYNEFSGIIEEINRLDKAY